MIRFTIPGCPVTKKNSQRIAVNRRTGRPFVLPSEAFEAYQEAAGLYIPFHWGLIDYPVNLCCVYYMPTARRVDLGNLLAATCDILTHYGVLKDDDSRIVAGHDGSRVYTGCKDHPRAEITITRLEETNRGEGT